LKYLFVCKQTNNKKSNCSHCFNCLTTMLYLVCANSLNQSKTFNKTLDIEVVKKIFYDYKSKQHIYGEMVLTYLQKQHREPELQEAISYSLEKSKHPKIFNQIQQAFLDKKRYFTEVFYRKFAFQTPAPRKNAVTKLFVRNIPHQ